ncbi:MAG TPA: hypothetical protein VJI32_03755 [Candidatus Nanoarchaeia archaeon]|nr:hypothetical protein [Candidatus Nanoarchaeia archaeon]
MLPTIEEMQEFVKEIPPTAEGKLAAMNKLFSREKDMAKAFEQINLFFQDLIKNNPDYLEAIKNCKTEEEIKQTTAAFYANNPKMAEETLLSMLAVKRDKWEEQEQKKENNG